LFVEEENLGKRLVLPRFDQEFLGDFVKFFAKIFSNFLELSLNFSLIKISMFSTFLKKIQVKITFYHFT